MLTAHQPFEARTVRNARIPKWLATRSEAIAWYETHAHLFPGCFIIQNTKRGVRNVWPRKEKLNVQPV